MSYLLEARDALVCPRGTGSLNPICLDLSQVNRAESRIHEVAFVTPHKAPELLAEFNRAFLDLTRHISALEYERIVAETAANKIRAIILLDKVPDILKEKGLASARSPAGSEDLRQAILDSNEEYLSAKDVCDQISAVIKLLQGKMKSIEMAYSSVKKIIGENVYNMNNPLLRGGAEDESSAPFTVSEKEMNKSPFGKARY